MSRFVLPALTLLGLASAAIPEHQITKLPGWDGALPSKQYSYLSVDDSHGRYLHYWLVESEGNPSTDPLVLWLNGGPGCSSLDGYLYEQGPFHFDANTPSNATVPNLIYNPYTWAKLANILFLEAPAGVGYSYSKTPADYTTNDTQTATDNYQFLLQFFQKYPEFNTTFFVAGESYAGVYVPTLVDTIRIGNDAGVNPFIPLEGFAVGNGCTGNDVGICSSKGTGLSVEYLYGHALYSSDTYKNIKAQCGDLTKPNPTAECENALGAMGQEVNDVNIYDIYGDCVSGGLLENENKQYYPRRSMKHIPNHPLKAYFNLQGPAECIDGIQAYQYLNDDSVRSSLHVQSKAQGGEWHICTSNIHYTANTASLFPIYPTLIKKYRTLIFNGDADACVPVNDNEQWTEGLGIDVKDSWRAWKVDNQVAGYVTVYDLNNFTFLTVKGAGHMVPEYKPKQAFAMFQRFLANQPF